MDNTYDMDASESALMESVIRKKNANSGRLMETIRNKAEKELEVQRRIKSKLGLASATLNEDANPPIHEFVKLVKQGPKQGEPAGLMWAPTSVENILAMYPQKTAISDINSAISAANQQSDVPIALVGPGDTRGELFIKTDSRGNIFMATGDKNPAAFANPAASSTTLAGSVPTTSSFEKPQINTGDVRHIIESMAEDIKALRNEVKNLKEAKPNTSDVDDMYFGGTGLSDRISGPEARSIASEWHSGKFSPSYAFSSSGHFSPDLVRELSQSHKQASAHPSTKPEDLEQLSSLLAYATHRAKHESELNPPAENADESTDPLSMDNLLVERMNIKKQMEGLDDKSKAVIQKLLNAADAIRNGKAALLDDISEPISTSSTNTTLNESAETTKTRGPSVSLDSLHEMLLKTTKTLSTNKSNVQLEHLADNISTLIAEGLMNDKINSTNLLNETIKTYKDLVE